MSKIDQYIHAATRDNTRRSYRSAIEHFEDTWGGFLPATADSVAQYLAEHAESLSLNTLKLRLAAIAQWHIEQGFPDPTKTPLVKKVLKGIKELHPQQEQRAKSLQIEHLRQLVDWLDLAISNAVNTNNQPALTRHSRDKAIVLVGFWRAFRSDEIVRMTVENIDVYPNEGMVIFLPRSKGDRESKGRYFKVPALTSLCPVTAYQDWIRVSDLQHGAVFRGVNRWGRLSEQALNPNSIISLLRKAFKEAHLPEPDQYSSHSLRRGFATWANSNQWDVKNLMEYVGWKDIKSAMRYIDHHDPFLQHKIESGIQDLKTN